MTRCAYCGAEMPDSKVCSSCGKEAPSLKGIEVQYRDFKVTEMLDIKIPSQVPPRKDQDKSRPLPAQEKKMDKQPLPEKKPSQQKSFPFLIAAVIIAVAGIALFLLVRFLIHY